MTHHFYSTPFVIRPVDDFVQNYPSLRRKSQILSIKYANNEPVEDSDLQEIGKELWQALGIDDSFSSAKKAAKANILPIIIESKCSDIQALPWEVIFHPKFGFLGKQIGFTLSRNNFKKLIVLKQL